MTAPRTTRRECEAGCGKPAADGWGICRGCHRRTGMHLSDIAGDLTAEMETTLTGQGRTGPDRVGSRSSVIPLPFDPQASAVVTDVHAKLVGWCLLLRDEAGADLPADTVQAMASHALGWLDWLAKHPAVEELVAEVAEMVRMIEHAIDLPPTRSRIFVGPCPEVVEDVCCPGELWALFPRSDAISPSIACGLCGAMFEPEQWSRLGDRVRTVKRSESGSRRLMDAIIGRSA